MARSKVRQFIKNLGMPKLTDEEIRIIKEHHEYHGDKHIKIIGHLSKSEVFVRVVNHMGHCDSVIDDLCYKDDCSEDVFIRNASEEREIAFIKKWLKENLPEDELRKLKSEGKL